MTYNEMKDAAREEARTVANNAPGAKTNTAAYIEAFTAAYKAAWKKLEAGDK